MSHFGNANSIQARGRPTTVTFVLIFLFVWCWLPSAGAEDAIQQGRDALNRSGQYPWYDPSTDGLKRLDPARVKSNRSQDRSSSSGQDGGRRSSQNEIDPSFRFGSTVLGGLFQAAGGMLLVLLLIALIAILLMAYLKLRHRNAQERSILKGHQKSVDQPAIERLPFDPGLETSELLSAVERNYESGNYAQAMIYLFSYQLLHLDKHHLIRLIRGRTNRQYLFQLRARDSLFRLIEQSIIAFEDVFFGKIPFDRWRFENCWQRLEEFHQLVEEAQVAAHATAS